MKGFFSNKLSALFFVLLLILSGCGTASDDNTTPNEQEEQTSGSDQTSEDVQTGETTNPIVTIVMENDEEIKVELYPEVAPNTVNNFISLVNSGYYNGVIFHRVIPGFMVQGGDPQGTGMGGPGYTIKGEFSNNGFENNLQHEPGVISMARTQVPDSAGSQFFIMVENAPHLDGEYAAFGKVIDGMDTVNEIVQVERDAGDRPLQDQKMKSVTVETFDVEYPEPEIIQ